jgi:hypothetical protein
LGNKDIPRQNGQIRKIEDVGQVTALHVQTYPRVAAAAKHSIIETEFSKPWAGRPENNPEVPSAVRA